MPSFTNSFVLASLAACSVAGPIVHVLNSPTANLPYDPNTTEYCSWWWDNDGSASCQEVVELAFISLEDFLRWNPSVTPECGNFKLGFSYCIEALDEPSQTTTSGPTSGPTSDPTTHPTSTSTEPTSTQPPNGIETPLPIQPGMVDNCDAFHFVKQGESCATISSAYGISLSQFTTWNPTVGSTCGGIWANSYVCVSIIGHSSETTTPTPIAPPNGIETPLPIQPGMVDNCDDFHFVKQGESCATISSTYGISLSQFTTWNPTVGSACGGIWANSYVCVSIIGHTPKPVTSTTLTTQPPATTTNPPSNGIQTPLPIQPGMVNNCDAFYFVMSGDECAAIARKKGITLANFYRWNPGLNNKCSGLWLDSYVCVSVEGHTPTPTNPGNGIVTPSPVQPGITSNCKTFYFVKTGDICATITGNYQITLAKFVNWNPAVKSDCSGMWANTYVCVAIL